MEEVSLPHSTYALPAYYFITSAEASSGLARYDGVHYGYRSENASNLDEIYKKSRAEGIWSRCEASYITWNLHTRCWSL